MASTLHGVKSRAQALFSVFAATEIAAIHVFNPATINNAPSPKFLFTANFREYFGGCDGPAINAGVDWWIKRDGFVHGFNSNQDD
jgi:hypothetical protein